MTVRSTRAQIAPDPALPQLSLLLEAEHVVPALTRTLGREVAYAEIAYVSYVPGESALVQYRVTTEDGTHEAVVLAEAQTDLAERAAAPEARALVRAVDGRTPALNPLEHDPELDVLIQWPPLDLALPAFAEPVEQLRERIGEAGVELRQRPPELVHYKPGRRAAFRFGDRFVKIYASRGLFERSVHNLRAVESLSIRTPRCEAVVPELRIQVQSLVAGSPPAGSHEVATGAGDLIARLHAAPLEGLRAAPPAYWLRSADKSARVLAAVVPALERRLESFVRELERRLPENDVVPSHGDFDVRQLLALGGDFGLVDFDRMSTAPRAFDLASYIAVVADHEGLAAAFETLDALSHGYGGRPANVPWYLAIVLLRRARSPFRRFRDGWPEQIAARIAVAESALRS